MQVHAGISIHQAIVHQVGNKARGEDLNLSQHTLTLNDELVRQMLAKYILQHVNEQEQYKFVHPSELALNEVYLYASRIFQLPASFTEQSRYLAQWLYQASTHVRIRQGELYIVHLEGILLDGETTEALAIVKSESKSSFLKILQHGQSLEVVAEEGIQLQKPDKACLIFNREKEDGYRVCIIDHVNPQQDAQYWSKTFLQTAPVADHFHQTREWLDMCRRFATEEMPAHFEVTKGQQIDLVQRSLEYCLQNEQFDLNGFAEEVVPVPELAEPFMAYKDRYFQSRQLEADESFAIHQGAVKQQRKVFKSVLKLDKNFHVYIHGRRDLIERGYDEQTGKHFYKIYFDEEA